MTATLPNPPTETVRYLHFRVEVTCGPDKGLALETAGRVLRIGTAPDSDVVLTDDTVSRRHCEIELTQRGFRVCDRDSTNGVRIAAGRIHDGSFDRPLEITLGTTAITITPLASSEERELARVPQFGALRGQSAKMCELFAQLARVAPTNASVLIEGETGTGKDVVAESIHQESARRDGPYVVFDCSAVAPNLIESELFGHEKGAFTGASNTREGVFEEAAGGTLFLDEIGELPKELQPKLLRVLQNRVVKRLGGRKPVPIDVRVVSATNRRLASEVRLGNFRQDLYYRIATIKVALPPLRERLDDLPILLEHFLHSELPGSSLASVPRHVLQMMQSHRWPGNVRELRNAVERMLIAPELSPVLDSASLSALSSLGTDDPRELLALPEARRRATESFEREYLKRALRLSDGSVTRAAACAQVSRAMIHKLMRKYGL